MRSALIFASFPGTILLGMLWTGGVPAAKAPPGLSSWDPDAFLEEETPLPTENRLDPEKEEQQRREEWQERRHRAPPGYDWKTTERRNGDQQIRKRNLLKAAPPDDQESRWVERGSVNQAGRMLEARVAPDGSLYAGAAMGGVWKRDSNGWAPLGDNLYGGVHRLELLKGSPPVILASTDWGYLHRSADEGQSWESPSGLPAISETRRIRVTPEGKVYLLTGAWGSYTLWRSEDQAQSFQEILDFGSFAGDIWTPRDQEGALYVYLQNRILLSRDGGETFEPAAGPPGDCSSGSLAGSEAETAQYEAPRLYLLAQCGGSNQLFRSDDEGVTWTAGAVVDDFWGRFEASMVNRNLLAEGGFQTWRSEDGGASLQLVNDWTEYYDRPEDRLHADLFGLSVVPNGDGTERWYIGTDGGLFLSEDGLKSVQNLSLSGLRVSQYYSTLTSSLDPTHVAAGAQDQGYQLSGEIAQGGGDLFAFDQQISGDYGHLSSGDGSHAYVYSTYPGFILVQMGEEHPAYAYLDYPSGENEEWLPPVVADPQTPEDFYFLASHLYRYQWDRRNWVPVQWSSQDFASHGDEYLSGLVFSPVSPERVYAATNYGRLFVSDDHGVTWSKSQSLAPSGHYFYGTSIIASREDPDTAWVGGSGYGNPAVYRTTDGGQTWEPWGEGLPDTLVYALVEAPDGSGALFAGTETAAYRRDAGSNTWVDITTNQAPVTTYWSAEALTAENTIRFGTYARGIWDYQLDPNHTGCYPVQDADQDGVGCDQDCDDHDPSRFPGATDLCDATDQDCNLMGEADVDGDGSLGCVDCDDTRSDLFPGAEEVCGDGVDQNCDGQDCRKPKKDACGCASSDSVGWAWGLLGLMALLRRRRVSPDGP